MSFAVQLFVLIILSKLLYVEANISPTISNSSGKYCVAEEDCFIDCSSHYESTGVLSQCGYGIVDASLSKSVSVSCSEQHSCDYMQVICPINGGNCNVNIFDNVYITSLLINATAFVGNNLNIHLNVMGRCDKCYIYANDTIGSDLNMNISCLSRYSCSNILVNGSFSELNNVNIKCNGVHSCSDGDGFYLQNANNIDIKCEGITPKYDSHGSCTNQVFDVQEAINVNIQCLSTRNCEGATIYAEDVDKLDIICDGDISCTGMTIYAPSNKENIFTLTCYNGLFDYSCDAMYIHIEDAFIPNFIYLNCQSSKACNYIDFICDTKGASILNNDYISCNNDDCCPIQRTHSPTKPTQTSSNSSNRPTNAPNSIPSKLPTNSNNGGNVSSISPTNTAPTADSSGSSATSTSSDGSSLEIAWIVLIIIVALLLIIAAAWIGYKMGTKKQIEKQMNKSFELIDSQQNENTAQ